MIIPGAATPSKRGNKRVKNRSSVLEDATVREFGGGWNVVDNELNLSTRFATTLDNMSREEDGSMSIRWGTQVFSDLGDMSTTNTINVNIYYFQDSVITVLSNGEIVRTDAEGVSNIIWSDQIANGLTGTPDGWGDTEFASFAVFNGKLIVCNGTDKPLIMDFNNAPPVQYLADESTGSNVNVPIGRYVIAMNKYLCISGDPLYPDRVHISNQNTSGTWYGDPEPNDGTYVDLGKVGVQGEQRITGLNRYRNQLVVGFLSASVLGKLGTYSTDDPPLHVPDFNDVIEGYGCHSHRSMVNLGNDLFMLDDQGITSIARSLYSGSTEPKRVSELIDPAVNANVNRLREFDTLVGAHGVYNSNDKQYMCFVPNHAPVWRNMQEDSFEALLSDKTAIRVRFPAHNLEVGDEITFRGCTGFNNIDASVLNARHSVTRVIDEDIFEITPPNTDTDPSLAEVGGGSACEIRPEWTETLGYVYTFVNELKIRAWARYRGWRWRASCRTELGTIIFADDDKLYLYGSQNRPLYEDYVGSDNVTPITWAWEWPWADFDQRMNVKHTRYTTIDSVGGSDFTMMMFVDQIYKREGWLVPNIVKTFTAGSVGGYGNGKQSYGGGRNTQDQRLYEWPSRGKLFKLRFQGTSTESLRIVAVSLLYQNGSIRR